MPIRKYYQYPSKPPVSNPQVAQIKPVEVKGFRVGRFNLGINTTFIVYQIGRTLIDTGPSNQWRDIKRQLQQADIKQLLITHHHEDHAGNAGRIAALKQLTPLAPALGLDKIAQGYKTPLLQRLIWGAPLPSYAQAMASSFTTVDGYQLQAIATPGHAKDLTCLFFPQQKYLFSGDMYISRSLKYLRVDENLAQLINSLETLLKLDFEILFCPHNGVVEQGRKALQDKLNNLRKLCSDARQLYDQGLNEQQVMERLLGPEDWLAKLTSYNISKGNLIRQAIDIGG